MKVLIVDDNLIWTSRLRKSLVVLEHTPVVSATADEPCDLAIVNLSSPNVDPVTAISSLRERGVIVVCHAGHKEKELLEKGRQAGCSRIATHSELTFKLDEVLKAAIDAR